MAYSGGMLPEFQNNQDFAEKTFTFLKKALLLVDKSKPFRGPNRLKEGDFEYINACEGDIKDVSGREKILFKGEEVFIQNYIGGLVLNK